MSSTDTAFLNYSQEWEEFKQQLFQRGVSQVNLVTDVYTTTRWALDCRKYDHTDPYRDANLVYPANYVVNIQNRLNGAGLAPDFQLQHSSLSGNVQQSTIQAPYTVLAKYKSVQRRNLGLRDRWVYLYKPYSPMITVSNPCVVP